jgi:hypothetical protein
VGAEARRGRAGTEWKKVSMAIRTTAGVLGRRNPRIEGRLHLKLWEQQEKAKLLRRVTRRKDLRKEGEVLMKKWQKQVKMRED